VWGGFAEDEACSWVKSTVQQWCDDDAGAQEPASDAGALPRLPASRHRAGVSASSRLASTARRVRASSWPRSIVLCRHHMRSSKSGPKSMHNIVTKAPQHHNTPHTHSPIHEPCPACIVGASGGAGCHLNDNAIQSRGHLMGHNAFLDRSSFYCSYRNKI